MMPEAPFNSDLTVFTAACCSNTSGCPPSDGHLACGIAVGATKGSTAEAGCQEICLLGDLLDTDIAT